MHGFHMSVLHVFMRGYFGGYEIACVEMVVHGCMFVYARMVDAGRIEEHNL